MLVLPYIIYSYIFLIFFLRHVFAGIILVEALNIKSRINGKICFFAELNFPEQKSRLKYKSKIKQTLQNSSSPERTKVKIRLKSTFSLLKPCEYEYKNNHIGKLPVTFAGSNFCIWPIWFFFMGTLVNAEIVKKYMMSWES